MSGNRKEIIWLLIATSIIFRVWQAFWIFDFFNDFFFLQKIQHKVLNLEIQLTFFILWVWHLKMGTKSKNYQKVSKTTLKLEKHEFEMSYSLNWKLKGDSALNLIHLDNLIAIFDFSHPEEVNSAQRWTKNSKLWVL